MAVYYKFKSAKDFDSIPIEGQFISVANLKERIFETKNLGRGTDFDLMLSNAQNDEEYVDEAAMIPKNTSVLIRRIPGRPRRSIANDNDEPKAVENKVEDLPPSSGTFIGDSSTMRYPEESEWDEFGNDLYAIPEFVPAQSINPVIDVSPAYMVDEDSKIKALIDTPSLDWNRQSQDTYGAGRGYGRGFGGRMMSGRGFGRGGGLERKTPPAGYICHRCKVPGHFIQHCPTNGDPNYDVKRVKPPTGIPKSMLMATPDGSYALPSGAVAVLKPNEAAFEKEIEGIPTTRTVTANDFPPEFICPLCKEVMKDAALTSKCCCRSFCDKCIRDYIISKTMCICGATDILADDLLPNRTVRESINRILESTTSSNDNAGSLVQVPDMESVRHVQSKVTSHTFSAVSRDEVNLPPKVNVVDSKKEASEGKEENVSEHSFNKKAVRNTDQSEATLESISVKEPISPESAPVPDEAQEKLLANDPGKKKKKKKPRIPGTEMQWRPFQDFGAENFTGMPLPPSSFNPYWHGGMPMGIDGYMAPFTGNMPYLGYTPGPPFDVPFGGMLPQDPFAAQAYMMPGAPQRDLSELVMGGMGMNQGPSIMSREEFEARKADLRRKREIERHSEREHSKDRGREAAPPRSSMDVPPTKAKTHHLTSHSTSGVDRPRRTERSDRSERRGRGDRNEPRRDPLRRSPQHRQQQTSGKRKAAVHDEAATATASASEAVAEKKQKTSVFSRISFPGPGEGGKKKRKSEESPKTATTNSVPPPPPPVNGYCYDHDESSEEEEYHFKRRPSASSQREEKEGRAARGSRDREQGHASCRSST